MVIKIYHLSTTVSKTYMYIMYIPGTITSIYTHHTKKNVLYGRVIEQNICVMDPMASGSASSLSSV